MGGVMKAISGMLMPKMPKAAAATSMPPMPDPAAPAARLAAREKIEERQKKGRAGTIYSNRSAPAASDSYSNQSLGGTR